MIKFLRKLLGVKEPDNLIDDWIWTLHSGKYKQGIGRLRDNKDNFCVLGVLCDIAGIGEWIKDEKEPCYRFYSEKQSFASKTFPSEELVNLVALETKRNKYAVNIIFHELADMNDSGHSFYSLAEKISETFKERNH